RPRFPLGLLRDSRPQLQGFPDCRSPAPAQIVQRGRRRTQDPMRPERVRKGGGGMPETMSTVEIDEAIERTEKLYRAMTGDDAPPVGESAYAPIPAEKDPTRYVEEQADRLLGMLRMTPGRA